VLLPGLINTHTHLELTHLRGAVPEADFFEWIQQIRRKKASTTPEQFVAAAKEGVREAWAGGVTTVADTGDSGAAARALSEMGGRGIVYQEVFGPHPDQAGDAMAGLREAVARLRGEARGGVTVGVSPHSPYTVSAPLFRRVAEWARAERLPMAVHLGESAAETAFITRASGPFADLWNRRGIPLPDPAPSAFIYLDRVGVLGPDLLAIHGTQASTADAQLLADRGVAVTLCPGSNARHGHGEPPAAAYRKAGVRLSVGTDSVASVERMDLFAEARAAGRLAALDLAAQIALMTLDGAVSLGLESQVGSLDAGKWADLCLCRVAPGGPTAGVASRVLEAGGSAVAATWVGGRLVNGGWPAAENSR
jgi:5-methylthioadenosine/S-adenosylhomocysteine deaminase